MPSDVYATVMRHFQNYEYYTELVKKGFTFYEDYSLTPSSFPHEDGIVIKSGISRRTEDLALEAIRQRAAVSDAKENINHIEKGLARAAFTAHSLAQVKDIYEDLIRHFIYGVPNISVKVSDIGRSPKSFSQYKKKAIYFTAEEFGLIPTSSEDCEKPANAADFEFLTSNMRASARQNCSMLN